MRRQNHLLPRAMAGRPSGVTPGGVPALVEDWPDEGRHDCFATTRQCDHPVLAPGIGPACGGGRCSPPRPSPRSHLPPRPTPSPSRGATGTLTASWPAVSGATKYHTTYSTDGGSSWHAPVNGHTNITTNSITFNADNAKSYIVGVRAGNDDGWSGWRNSPSSGPYTPRSHADAHTVATAARPGGLGLRDPRRRDAHSQLAGRQRGDPLPRHLQLRQRRELDGGIRQPRRCQHRHQRR